MPAYIIGHIEITDAQKYGEYTQHTPRVIAQFGGRFIVRGASPETLEGAPEKLRIVVIEFPSLEDARRFYHSPEYAEIMKIRKGAGNAQLVAVAGYPTDDWNSSLEASRQLR